MVCYLLVDLNNLANRAVHVVKNSRDETDWIARSMGIVFRSLRAYFHKFRCDHVVVCVDSWSWRESIYPEYKLNRKLDPETKPLKIAARTITHRLIDQSIDYLTSSTNVTVLRARGIESDDFIARWTQLHPGQEHIILSNDADFKQLVAKNIDLYDPLHDLLFTLNGILYQDKKPLDWLPSTQHHGETWKYQLDEKNEPIRFNPEWELFIKLIKGDARDNIKPAYPRVSIKKVEEAFADRGGPKWNNLINSTWGKENNSVRSLYEMNRQLIDLTAQPEEIKTQMDQSINTAIKIEPKQMVAPYFERFCNKYHLRLIEIASEITPLLSSPYRT